MQQKSVMGSSYAVDRRKIKVWDIGELILSKLYNTFYIELKNKIHKQFIYI